MGGTFSESAAIVEVTLNDKFPRKLDLAPWGDSDIDRLGRAVVVPTPATCHPSELMDEWSFFNHGALFSFGGFQSDPLADWMDSLGKVVPVQQFQYQTVCFRNLPGMTPQGVSWDRVLYAVPTEYWLSLEQFLFSITMLDNKTRFVARPFFAVVHGKFEGDAKKIYVAVTCIESTEGVWHYGCDGFQRSPPTQAIKKIQRGLFSTDIDPLLKLPNINYPADLEFHAQPSMEDVFRAYRDQLSELDRGVLGAGRRADEKGPSKQRPASKSLVTDSAPFLRGESSADDRTD